MEREKNSTERLYYYWDIANTTKMGQYLTKRELEYIKNAINLYRKNYNQSYFYLLDIGCGSGRFSIPIIEIFSQIFIISLDINITPLKLLQYKIKNKNNKKNLHIIKSDGSLLPFDSNSIDFILAIEVLEYINNPNLFLAECYRVLKPGGYLLFTFANKKSYKSIIQSLKLKIKKSSQRKTYKFDLHEITLLLKTVGFNLFQYMGFNWIPFKRNSDSNLISLFDLLEEKLGIGRVLAKLSPWIIVTAIKNNNR